MFNNNINIFQSGHLSTSMSLQNQTKLEISQYEIPYQGQQISFNVQSARKFFISDMAQPSFVSNQDYDKETQIKAVQDKIIEGVKDSFKDVQIIFNKRQNQTSEFYKEKIRTLQKQNRQLNLQVNNKSRQLNQFKNQLFKQKELQQISLNAKYHLQLKVTQLQNHNYQLSQISKELKLKVQSKENDLQQVKNELRKKQRMLELSQNAIDEMKKDMAYIKKQLQNRQPIQISKELKLKVQSKENDLQQVKNELRKKQRMLELSENSVDCIKKELYQTQLKTRVLQIQINKYRSSSCQLSKENVELKYCFKKSKEQAEEFKYEIAHLKFLIKKNNFEVGKDNTSLKLSQMMKFPKK